MKTGIVIEVSKGKATVMKNNGEFISMAAQKTWQKGDVVAIKSTTSYFSPFYPLAACFVLIFSLGMYGYTIYFNETSLVSIDVNPSIELSLNRFDRVIEITSRNGEGEALVSTMDVKNKRYNEAIELLVDSKGLNKYMKDEVFVCFTVQSHDLKKEEVLLSDLQDIANKAILAQHEKVTVEYYRVDEKFVDEAHLHGVTAGKYMALVQLKEAIPTVDINQYTHHSIEDIKTEIEIHESEHHGSKYPKSKCHGSH